MTPGNIFSVKLVTYSNCFSCVVFDQRILQMGNYNCSISGLRRLTIYRRACVGHIFYQLGSMVRFNCIAESQQILKKMVWGLAFLQPLWNNLANLFLPAFSCTLTYTHCVGYSLVPFYKRRALQMWRHRIKFKIHCSHHGRRFDFINTALMCTGPTGGIN